MRKSLAQGFIIVCLAAGYYLYEFTVRVSTSVLANPLMASFSIGAAVVGLISACFFYAYIPLQIPAGIICDRFGPRRVLSAMVLFCAAGVALFAWSPQWQWAAVARFLIGSCAAFAPISAFILCHHWLPRRHFAMAVGLIQTLGCMGGILGGAPIVWAVDLVGWRHAYGALACLGVVIWLAIVIAVRDNPNYQATEGSVKSWHDQWLLVRQVITHRQTWWIGVIALSFWAPMSVFAELWGVNFLVVSRHISTESAATFMQMVWVGVGVGGPIMGWCSDRLKHRKGPILFSFFLGLLGCWTIVYQDFSGLVLCVALLAMGVSASGMCLTFGLVGDVNAGTTLGTAIGFNNMATILGGGFLQPLVGWALHHVGTPVLSGGLYHYSLHGYRVALSIIPVMIMVGMLTTLFAVRETRCRKLVNTQADSNPG